MSSGGAELPLKASLWRLGGAQLGRTSFGKLVQIGITPEKEMSQIPQAYTPVHCKKIEGTLYGNIEPHRDIPAFADMAMRGDLLLEKLITKFFKVNEINDVAERMRQRQITGRWVCKWE